MLLIGMVCFGAGVTTAVLVLRRGYIPHAPVTTSILSSIWTWVRFMTLDNKNGWTIGLAFWDFTLGMSSLLTTYRTEGASGMLDSVLLGNLVTKWILSYLVCDSQFHPSLMKVMELYSLVCISFAFGISMLFIWPTIILAVALYKAESIGIPGTSVAVAILLVISPILSYSNLAWYRGDSVMDVVWNSRPSLMKYYNLSNLFVYLGLSG
jgi:hypothetical protein